MKVKTNNRDSLIKITGNENETKPIIMIIAIPSRRVFNCGVRRIYGDIDNIKPRQFGLSKDDHYEFWFDARNFKNSSLIEFKGFKNQSVTVTVIPCGLRQPRVFVQDNNGQDINKLAMFYYKRLR